VTWPRQCAKNCCRAKKCCPRQHFVVPLVQAGGTPEPHACLLGLIRHQADAAGGHRAAEWATDHAASLLAAASRYAAVTSPSPSTETSTLPIGGAPSLKVLVGDSQAPSRHKAGAAPARVPMRLHVTWRRC